MWAQYGAGHTGIALILDRMVLEQSAQCLTKVGHVAFVDVDSSLGLANSIGAGIRFDAATPTAPRTYLVDNLAAIFGIKHPDWAAEAEFRVVLVPKPGFGEVEAFVPIDRAVVGLAVGDQVTPSGRIVANAFIEEFELQANASEMVWEDPLRPRVDRWLPE